MNTRTCDQNPPSKFLLWILIFIHFRVTQINLHLLEMKSSFECPLLNVLSKIEDSFLGTVLQRQGRLGSSISHTEYCISTWLKKKLFDSLLYKIQKKPQEYFSYIAT